MRKLNKLKYLLLGVIIVSLGIFYIGRVVAQEQLERDLETYLQALDIVKNEYVEKKLDDKKLVYGSIRGLLSALDDPYTRFMEPSAFKEMKVRMGGSYSGIGIYIGIKDNQLSVISPIPGTPAHKKLKSGDMILTIDTKITKDMALEEAVSLIRGPRGTKVKLGILRNGWKDPKDYEIVRDKIVIKSVEAKKFGDDIAYIKLNTFENLKSADEFQAVLRKSKYANGLVIDLRGNGGGLLSAAIEIGGMFIDDGVIVQTVDRDGRTEEMRSSGKVLWTKPVVVLIDGGSASASEILAGALRDNKAATLVGTKTFGKASVQNVRQLNDGSAILVTIAKYLTPSGEYISKKGIAPDVEVTVPTKEVQARLESDDFDETKDVQLQAAIRVLQSLIKESGNAEG
ncbi:MAG: S41 family peptidase [Candidatus Margulisbacteria bacterium]|nr:S41 family peptidase [Candidatus Margulisiibacteriota bacterium]